MKVEINNSKLYVTVDSVGAEVKGLRDLHGMEYIWKGDDVYWGYSSPILFPIVGGLRNGKYLCDGKEYKMARHGFCRPAQFRKVDGRTDAVTFCLSANEETKKQYPFDFELYISYELVDFSLAVKFKVVNKDSKAMPFCIGAHPAICVPLEEGEDLTDYRVKFMLNETVSHSEITADGLIDNEKRTPFLQDEKAFTLNSELFKNDALVFDDLKSRSVEMYSIVSGRGVRIDFDGFDYFGIWQPYKNGTPFVCLEPWTGTATLTTEGDELQSKRGMKILETDESFEVQYKITVI